MHHEPETGQEILDLLKRENARLNFPEGQLTSPGEGEIKFAIADHQGTVIINFGTPVQSLGMTPGQARQLARLLIARAKKIEGPPARRRRRR